MEGAGTVIAAGEVHSPGHGGAPHDGLDLVGRHRLVVEDLHFRGGHIDCFIRNFLSEEKDSAVAAR